MSHFSPEFLQSCKAKLIEKKRELIMQLNQNREQILTHDGRGDEGDLSLQVMQEHQIVQSTHRLRHLILEVENALARMEQGIYGICEVTDEPIELARLATLPWTRVSIEGAEMREQKERRSARY